MRWILITTLTLATGCSCLRARVSASLDPQVGAFEVPPYLLAAEGKGLLLVWRPWRMAGGAGQVVVRRPGETVTIAAQQAGGVRFARLPWRCDDAVGAGAARYRVRPGGGWRRLDLPPCADAPTSRFVVISDTQGDLAPVRRLVGLVADEAHDFVLHPGDHVNQGGCAEQWPPYLRAMSPLISRAPMIPAVGNHERFLDRRYRQYRRYLTPGDGPPVLTFTAGPVDVIVINSEDLGDEAYDRAQLAWLRAALASLDRRVGRAGRWRVAMMHHPPHSSSISNAWYSPQNRAGPLVERYMPLLRRAGVRLVIAGHAHVYERSEDRGVHFLVAGTAGGILALEGGANPHRKFIRRARTVSTFVATATRLRMRTLDMSGAIIDRLTLTRAGASRRAGSTAAAAFRAATR